jgi:radical SAM superfamily enzyme YgiQ (UPF0313 family)
MNPESRSLTRPARRKRFELVLIKPSHYDDDGYVIQWWRSAIPSNSLAVLYGLGLDCAERAVLGEGVEMALHAIDETNTRVRSHRLAALIKQAEGGMVMLVGVQSNQFPRALDLARTFQDLGVQVVIGGFHVSGVISMLDGADPDLDRARAMGVSLFAGEAEGRFDEVLLDAFAGKLKPLYNHMADLPGIAGAPIPMLPADRVRRTMGHNTTLDAGRGCPYQCSFCTIINVQGRKSRRRSPDDIERIVRENLAQGLHDFFITDDNFARNKDWEAILDRLIFLRRVQGLVFSLTIQVDTLCHRLPGFIEKCALAGVRSCFIGLENINPDNLAGAKKKQNKITEYRKMLLAWKRAGVLTYAGYILGFPNDTLDSILHDIDVIKRELPVELLEFFFLTPLPGSEDHQKLHRAGVAMDPDLNKYDLNHRTTAHPRMSATDWEQAYAMAWARYYTYDHIETMTRRVAVSRARRIRVNVWNAVFSIGWFKGSIDIEKVHPLEGGYFRLKYRRDRRPERGIEPMWRFYPHYLGETLAKQARWIAMFARLVTIYRRVTRDAKRFEYTDAAMTPVVDAETETGELFKSDAARAYVEQERRLRDIREAGTSRPARPSQPAIDYAS